MQELARLSCEEYHKVEKLHIVVVLDDVRSLNNIGSIFRTADAFLIEKIYLCGITATPPSPDIHKTALGAEDSVEWEYVDNVVNLVENIKYVPLSKLTVASTCWTLLLISLPNMPWCWVMK